jgi:hypothetical protein
VNGIAINRTTAREAIIEDRERILSLLSKRDDLSLTAVEVSRELQQGSVGHDANTHPRKKCWIGKRYASHTAFSEFGYYAAGHNDRSIVP